MISSVATSNVILPEVVPSSSSSSSSDGKDSFLIVISLSLCDCVWCVVVVDMGRTVSAIKLLYLFCESNVATL